MKNRPQAPWRWRTRVVAVVLTGAAGLVLLATPAGDAFSRLSYDHLFALRPDVPVEEAVIVQMDEESHITLSQPGVGPWDRALHARLIERLTTLGAKAIAFDVLFLGERDPATDAQLAAAAKASGRVTFAALMAPETPRGELMGWRLVRPFSALAEVAPSGVVEEAVDDHAVRRHYWNPQYTNANSLAWETARLAGKSPMNPLGDRWVNYYGPPGWIPRVSYHRVFENDADAASVFSNKVVFVGAVYAVGFTGGKTGDEFRTPYTRWTGRLSPGVEIVATTYLNLVRRDWMTRLPPIVECSIILLTGLLMGLGLTACPPPRALLVAAGAAFAVAASAYLMAWQCLSWFPWLIIVAAQIPCALALALVAHAQQLYSDKCSLEERLALAVAAGVVRKASPGAIEALAFRVSSALRDETLKPAPLANPTIPDHELIKRIGEGAYGEVWLARDILGSYHAVKIVRHVRLRDWRPLEREFEGLRRFTPISRSHPHLMQILHVGRSKDGDDVYYVMEAADDEVTGQSIDERTYSPKNLARVLNQRERLPLEECLHLSISLASALEFLHQRQLVHRDVKPANVIFVNGLPKLADIGLVAGAENGSAMPTTLGTPGYMPPEGPGAPTGDIYSLGKLIYEAAFGLDCTRFPDLPRTLFDQAEEPRAFDLNRILLKACENDPSRRHRSTSELITDLRALLAASLDPVQRR